MLTLTTHNTECDIDNYIDIIYRINLQATLTEQLTSNLACKLHANFVITMGVHLNNYSLQRTKKTFQGVLLVRELQTVSKKFYPEISIRSIE